MTKRFNPLSTAVAIAVATAMIGGCAMQTRNGDMARADTEDASHPSTRTTLTAHGDPAPDVTQVALVPAPTVVAQADPMPATPPAPPAPVAQQWDNATQTASADPMQANRYNTAPSTTSSSTMAMSQPGSTSSTDTNASYGSSEPALAPRADRN